MISLRRLLQALLYLVIAGAIFGIIYWGLEQIALPSPFGYVAHLVLVFGIIITVISILLWMVGFDIFKPDKP